MVLQRHVSHHLPIAHRHIGASASLTGRVRRDRPHAAASSAGREQRPAMAVMAPAATANRIKKPSWSAEKLLTSACMRCECARMMTQAARLYPPHSDLRDAQREGRSEYVPLAAAREPRFPAPACCRSVASACLGIAACTGKISEPFGARDGDPGNVSGVTPGPLSPEPTGVLNGEWSTAPLSRITRVQLRNIAADVLGAKAEISDVLPDVQPDDPAADTNLLVDSYYQVAQRLAQEAVATGTMKGRCSSGADVQLCVRGAVTEVAPLLWHRSVDAAEIATLDTQVLAPAAALGGDEALTVGLTALMVSPGFVFRMEEPTDVAGPLSKLSSAAVATRLSFLAWNAGPD